MIDKQEGLRPDLKVVSSFLPICHWPGPMGWPHLTAIGAREDGPPVRAQKMVSATLSEHLHKGRDAAYRHGC